MSKHRKKRTLSKGIENLVAPTPKKWRMVRNISGTIAAIAGVLMFAPFNTSILAIIGVIGGIAAIIAGKQTITIEHAHKMSISELGEVCDILASKAYNVGLSEAETETLRIIREEMKSRGIRV